MTQPTNASPQLISLNVLQRPDYCRVLTRAELHPESPVAIKRNLGLDELDKQLFPTLVTGVRWWPFLTLALHCSNERDYQRVFKASRTLKAHIGRVRTARMGPEAHTSFRPYISMARNIRDDDKAQSLFQFLNKFEFDGDPKLFTQYNREQKWQELFAIANGKPATGYIKAYRKLEMHSDGNPLMEQVVSEILRQPPRRYDPLLWHGAFSFALIRCLFGRFIRDEGEAINHGRVMEWKSLLMVVMGNPPAELPPGACNPKYRLLLERIEHEDSPPPLASQTRQFRKEGRPVLASLRIPLFHRLYFKPTPV